MQSNLFKKFVNLESLSGLLLLGMTIIALILANSSAAVWYNELLNTMITIKVGNFGIAKPFLLWINDGLMSIFFFLIGLELKRELVVGELQDPKVVALPLICALGGMLIPALIFYFFNHNDSNAISGWAIPTATDIAFSLGILSLLGNRVPISLKIFLLSLAMFDDIGAIIVIALFYTSNLSILSLMIALLAIILLSLFNWRKVTSIAAYLFIGLILWSALLKSGVHSTIAGIVLAFFIPLSIKNKHANESPLTILERDLHPVVAYGIMPLFAFANSGISLNGFSLTALFHPVTMGVSLGLFLGKPIGILLFASLAVRLKIAKLPEGVLWKEMIGVGFLCGIGFTMSLFISSLAFEHTNESHFVYDRLGILLGSFFSGLVGYLILLKIKKA